MDIRRLTIVFVITFMALSASSIILDDYDAESVYIVQGGLTFVLNDDRTAGVNSYSGTGGDVVIPFSVESNGISYTVTIIDNGVFMHSDIRSVYIPDSVVKIVDMAFWDCDSLETVRMGNNVEYIGYGAFCSCQVLTAIHIPSSVSFIDEEAFSGPLLTFTMDPNDDFALKGGVLFSKDMTRLLCYPGGKTDAVYHMPSTVRDVDPYAFDSNHHLEELYLNEGLTSVIYPIFDCSSLRIISLSSTLAEIRGCLVDFIRSLEEIVVADGNQSFVVIDGILYTSDLKALICAPPAIDYETIIVPEGVEYLGLDSMFGVDAESVILPSTLTYIDNNAFMECSLTSIILPGSLEGIGYYTFVGCHLEEVTFMGVPTDLRPGCFAVDSDLLIERYAVEPIPLEDYVGAGTEVIYVPLGSGYEPVEGVVIGDLTFDLSSDGKAKLVGFDTKYVDIPETVTYNGLEYRVTAIQSELFKNSDIVSVSIPGTIEEIERWMFWHSHDLSDVTISEGVRMLGSDSFAFCYSLQSIHLPSTIEVIDEQPFYGCKALETITVSEDNVDFIVLDGVLFDSAVSTLYCYPSQKTDASYHVPSTVQRVGSYAISYNNFLQSLHLNEGLVETGYRSMIGCDSLSYIRIPSTASDLELPFARSCSGLETIKVESGNKWYTSIDGVLFTKDLSVLVKFPSIKDGHYDVPDGVREFADASFDYTDITSVTFPATLEVIGAYCFQNSHIESVTIPSSVSDIGQSAFTNSRLTEVTFMGIPEAIGDRAFTVSTDTITEYYAVEKVPLEPYTDSDVVYIQYEVELVRDLEVHSILLDGRIVGFIEIRFDRVIDEKMVLDIICGDGTMSSRMTSTLRSDHYIRNFDVGTSSGDFTITVTIGDYTFSKDVTMPPDRPSTVESADFQVYMKSVDGGSVNVHISSVDGGYIGDGSLQVTFFYTEYDDFVGDYVTNKRVVPSKVQGDGEAVLNIFVNIPTDLKTAYSASAVFTSNGHTDGSGSIFC